MRIILDFDYTVFDTEAFRVGMIDAFHECGVTDDIYRITEKELLHDDGYGVYSFDEHLQRLSQQTQTSIEQLYELAQTVLNDLSTYIYPDALAFLQLVQEEKHILTFGNDDWQRTKIQRSGIEEYITSIRTVQTQTKAEGIQALLNENEKTVFIDDRGSAIDEVKQVFPDVYCIRLHRKGTPYYDEECTAADAEEAALSPNILNI